MNLKSSFHRFELCLPKIVVWAIIWRQALITREWRGTSVFPFIRFALVLWLFTFHDIDRTNPVWDKTYQLNLYNISYDGTRYLVTAQHAQDEDAT